MWQNLRQSGRLSAIDTSHVITRLDRVISLGLQQEPEDCRSTAQPFYANPQAEHSNEQPQAHHPLSGY